MDDLGCCRWRRGCRCSCGQRDGAWRLGFHSGECCGTADTRSGYWGSRDLNWEWQVRRLLVAPLFGVLAIAQISAPRLGLVRDRAGSLRPVYGVAGSFTLGDSVLDNVTAVASGARYTFAATTNEVLLLDDLVVVWRASADSEVTEFRLDKGGRPASVRFSDGNCLVWRKRVDAPEAGACPEDVAVVQTKITLPENVETIEQLSEGMKVVRTSSRLYVLRTGDREALYELPEVSPQ
jgi:hypothetical protein